jgi:hypothetical protein
MDYYDNDKTDNRKESWELNRYRKNKLKYEQILRLYSVIGLLIGILSIIYFIFTTLDIHFDAQQQITLLISGVGLFLSFSSWFLLKLKQDKKLNEVQEMREYYGFADFILTWLKFEERSKKYLLVNNIKFNKFSIREVIKSIFSCGIITDSELTLLEQAMKLRNSLIHERNSIPLEIIMNYKGEIEKITNKIEEKYIRKTIKYS